MQLTDVSYARFTSGNLEGGRFSLPAWERSLPIWEWYSIPNTALSSIPPSPTPLGMTGPSSKITAWNGAWLRKKGSWYGPTPSGGHADYCGNEMNVIQLNTDVPAWTELRGSTANADIIESSVAYLDLRRSSGHTYYSLQYDNINDRVLVVSNAVPFANPAVPDRPSEWPYPPSAGHFMAYDWNLNDWLAPDALPALPVTSLDIAHLCCADPITNDIYFNPLSSGQLRKYSPTTNTWSIVGAWNHSPAYAGSAVDPVRNRMLVVGANTGSERDPFVRSTTNAAAVSVTFGGLGPEVLRVSGYPAVEFDLANDCYLVCINTDPIKIIRVRASDFYVDEPTITGTKPAQRPNGIQNSFRYVPELRGVVIANSYTGNVKFMRTHD